MSEVNYPAGTPASAPVAPGAGDPNKTFGIIALVVSIFFSLIGGILGIVAYTRSKKAGYKNGFALAAIIVGFVLFVIQVIVGILIAVAAVAAVNSICDGQAPGVYETTTGTTVTCP
jgi:hypothetical protein